MPYRQFELEPLTQEKLEKYLTEAIQTKSTSAAQKILTGTDQVLTAIAFSYVMNNAPAYGDNIVSDGNNASLNKKPLLGLSIEDVSDGSKPSLKSVNGNKKTNSLAKELGYDDAHDLKEAFVGKNEIAKFDIKYDSKTEEIFLVNKTGTIIVETNLFKE